MAPLFELIGVTFSHDERPLLAGVDLALTAGERVGLTGAMGSGKTTLLHLAVGLHTAQAGTIRFHGREYRREPQFCELRKRVGLVFQDSDDQLFCPTVLEDVAFGPLNLGLTATQACAAAARALAQVGLQGFEERVTYRLSGGEKRLVALATVLAMEPEVLLLDEPQNGLDSSAFERVGELLCRLPQSMLIVSHDRDFLGRVATRTVALSHGKIAAPASESSTRDSPDDAYCAP